MRLSTEISASHLSLGFLLFIRDLFFSPEIFAYHLRFLLFTWDFFLSPEISSYHLRFISLTWDNFPTLQNKLVFFWCLIHFSPIATNGEVTSFILKKLRPSPCNVFKVTHLHKQWGNELYIENTFSRWQSPTFSPSICPFQLISHLFHSASVAVAYLTPT